MERLEASFIPVNGSLTIRDTVSKQGQQLILYGNWPNNTGVSGDAHRVCMILNQYESSSGGPFFR